MSAQTIYSGPGKVIANCQGSAYSLQAEGENGQIAFALDEKTTPRSTAMHGRIRETLDNLTGKITLTPFDSWGLLPYLFPEYLGVSITGAAQTGSLAIGSRPHDWAGGSAGAPAANAKAGANIWTRDGRTYAPVRTGLVKHPEMKLGVGQPLFGGIEIAAIGDPSLFPGSSGFLLDSTTPIGGDAGTPVSDPDTVAGFPDYINEHWTAAWGSITGFVGMEAEDFWTLVPEIKYSELTVQKLTRHFKLDSVNFMIKFRPVGPTHTQIFAKINAHILGSALGEVSATDLVLTGAVSAKTVTLKNCEIKGAGFEFGGTKLGTGEVGFVTNIAFSGTPGEPSPSLIFS